MACVYGDFSIFITPANVNVVHVVMHMVYELNLIHLSVWISL